jgi:hypothetical protein
VPEQKIEPAEDAAGDDDKASEKQQRLQHGPLSHAGAQRPLSVTFSPRGSVTYKKPTDPALILHFIAQYKRHRGRYERCFPGGLSFPAILWRLQEEPDGAKKVPR